MLNISKDSISKTAFESVELHSLKTLGTPKTGRKLAWWIRIILILLVIVMFLPWQQNIDGKGAVTALNPQDRPQNVQNPVGGQIQKWYVQEGAFVNKGDTLLTITEVKDEYFDPNILVRTREQMNAKRAGINAYYDKVAALDQQVAALRNALDFSLQKARNKVRQARFKVISDSTDLVAQRRNFEIAIDRVARFEKGYKDGLFSLTDLETRRLKIQEDNAKVISMEQKLAISRNELINSKVELSSVDAEYRKDIAKAMSDRSSAVSSVADGDGELSKLKNKYASIQIRRDKYYVLSPQSGYVVKALKAGLGETIKEGESVVTLQPNNPKMAVELYIKAMDLPLVAIGRPVRVEFDGWPALQFSGWPSASVGTFGGTIEVIDRVTSKNGEYRLLVKPDKAQEAWPEPIRLGAGAHGWVMLDNVQVWWEIWRQLNGFPPNYVEDQQAEKGDKK